MSRTDENDRCNVCGEPLKGGGIDGTCQSCLLIRPMSARWDPREPPSAEQVDAQLSRFRIEKKLGKGALGAVYGAVDTKLDRIVAIKAMVENPANPEFSERFEREATAMAKLNHPNIVPIYDYGKAGDLYFLVMERMVGGSLADEIRTKKRLSPKRAVEIIGQVCDALEYVHSLRVFHRDVKPSNILLDANGNAKLSDFGLVKGLLFEEFAEMALTRSDMAVGTPHYMAPEQMEWPADADHRADIYSAGAVFYEMLTGEVPSGRHKAASTFGGVPRLFDAVIDRAMHRKPEGRYDSAKKMKQDVGHRQNVKRRWLTRLGAAAVFAIFVFTGVRTLESYSGGGPQWSVPDEAKKGLPLGSFESEVDFTDWQKIANYEFRGLGDNAHKQEEFTLAGGAVIEDGMLRLSEMGDSGSAQLNRDSPRPLKGLALHYRFKADEYLAVGRQNMVIVDFSLYWNRGLFLASMKWGDPRPTMAFDELQHLAPPGVVEARLEPGAWHEVWVVLEHDCKVWIDGQPVYRSDEPSVESWKSWGGHEKALLRFGGFRGVVDYVEVWDVW